VNLTTLCKNQQGFNRDRSLCGHGKPPLGISLLLAHMLWSHEPCRPLTLTFSQRERGQPGASFEISLRAGFGDRPTIRLLFAPYEVFCGQHAAPLQEVAVGSLTLHADPVGGGGGGGERWQNGVIACGRMCKVLQGNGIKSHRGQNRIKMVQK
jgi:hypothetical protein